MAYTLPRPGDDLAGRIVVAAAFQVDRTNGHTEPDGDEVVTLLLTNQQPYYTVAQVTKDDDGNGAWRLTYEANHRRFSDAVAEYRELGGR